MIISKFIMLKTVQKKKKKKNPKRSKILGIESFARISDEKENGDF